MALVIRSGRMSNRSDANQWPVRPNPVITSSAHSRMPYSSHSARTPWKYPAGGMNAPPEFCTGSMITIATVSGPAWTIVASRSSSRNAVNSSSVSSGGRW